jgi:4-amino-4-deoxy-L-arabinose transferase-like glycosyltransferase
MNQTDGHRKTYIALCFATAAIYAFCAGNQPALYRTAADAGIYGCMLCLTGMILRNIFRFAIPRHQAPADRVAVLLSLAVLSVLLTVGIEALAMYLLDPSSFRHFAATIPVRVVITLLIFAVARLYYLLHESRESAHKEQPVAAQPVDRITVRSGQKIKIIPVDEIIYIKADGDYISIHTSEGNWLKEQTMKHTEDLLPADKFLRIHRSFIVNACHISRIERYGEQQQVVLLNGEKIKISAARYHSLKQILGF